MTLRTLYQYVSSLTRPVTILLKNHWRVKAVLVFYPPGETTTQKSAYFAALSCWIIRFMASMPTFTAPEVSSVMGIASPAFSRS